MPENTTCFGETYPKSDLFNKAEKPLRLGTINIVFDSCDGSLNDYLLVGQDICNKPDYLAAIQAMYFDMKKMAAFPHDPVTHVATEKEIPAQAAGFIHVESDVRLDGQPCVYLYAGDQKIWIAGVVVEDE
ncbi:MAG: hypothetical protein ACRCWW_00010 [Scandinavium sp.]|uniref:hypothetical protein n=1 Tax=Scandinavium sp. TaxID=2830653 RepID=UPI003F2F0B57